MTAAVSWGRARTGWFAESIATQTLVAYVIRIGRVPFFKSRPSLPAPAPTAAVAAAAILHYTGLAHLPDFTPCSRPSLLPAVMVVV